MTKDELKFLGQHIAACMDKAKVARQKASDLETSAARSLEQAEQACKALSISYVYWVKRNTGMTYSEAETLRSQKFGWLAQRAAHQGFRY
jgi:hypothetical protein